MAASCVITPSPSSSSPKRTRRIRNGYSHSHYQRVAPRSCSACCSRSSSASFLPSQGTLFCERRSVVLSTALSLLLPPLPVAQAIESSDNISIIQNGVRNVLSKAKAAGILRLVFHDAGTFDLNSNSGGMNGSIIYELDRPENTGLKKSVKILEKAKREIETIQKVSWADLIAVAGAEAVSLCGGPTINIKLGRLDSNAVDPEGRLPEESLNAVDLKKCFKNKGFSTQEMVVLSGAHTIGNKGFGSPTKFDNSYFKILLEKPWISSGGNGIASMIGLPSDRALVEDDECLRWISVYARDQLKFFDDFGKVYVKLVNTGASWQFS
ncbi:hypothetical protein LUZ60_009697 [Juncus effusus]|nr:hypothetical protein LUZ60_009697 [Juncus effusus]